MTDNIDPVIDLIEAEAVSRVELEQHGQPVDAVQETVESVRAEFGAFRAQVLKVALREARRRDWCEEIYPVLRRAGFTEDELPLTHVTVRVTREFSVRLPKVDDLSSLTPYGVESVVTGYFRNHDMHATDYEVVTKPLGEESAA